MPAAEAETGIRTYLCTYQRLAGLAQAAGVALWKVRPKWHYMAHHAMDIAGSSGAAQAMISSMLHAGHESCSANCESCSGDVAREAASKLDSPILRMWSVMAVAADIVPAGYRLTSQATWKMNIMMLSNFADESFMGVVKRLTKRAHRMTAPPLHAMLSTPPLHANSSLAHMGGKGTCGMW